MLVLCGCWNVWIDKLCCYCVAVGMCGFINVLVLCGCWNVWIDELCWYCVAVGMCIDRLCWYCVAVGMCGLINCFGIVWLLECVD